MKGKYLRTLHQLENKRLESLFFVLDGLLVGLTAGGVTIAYRFLLVGAERLLFAINERGNQDALALLGWMAVLLVMGLVVGQLIKWESMASGSGIPQVTGEIKGYLNQRWWQIIVARLAGGTMSILGGLSLGREGPSIQLGAMAAKGAAKSIHADKSRERRMISCGAGAGLAAAFNAPLAGIMFVLEEIHHTFDKTILASGIVAAILADYLSKMIFGQSTIFSYTTAVLPLGYYWLLLVLGLLLGVAGVLYNKLMAMGQVLFDRLALAPQYRPVVPFLLAGLCGIFLPQILAGGDAMVELLMYNRPTISMLCLLLAAKFLFSLICFGSGAPGGIFFPLLILGSYLGAIYGQLCISAFQLDPALWGDFVIVSMAGFFAAIVRAPITGIILIAEMTGTLTRLLDVVLVSITAYVAANTLGSTPIYTTLLNRILKKHGNRTCPAEATHDEKILTTYIIPVNSYLAGRQVKDIPWCTECLIASIAREDKIITPKGDTIFQPGDELLVLISQENYAEDNAFMEEVVYGA